jgi:hypothetical protein
MPPSKPTWIPFGMPFLPFHCKSTEPPTGPEYETSKLAPRPVKSNTLSLAPGSQKVPDKPTVAPPPSDTPRAGCTVRETPVGSGTLNPSNSASKLTRGTRGTGAGSPPAALRAKAGRFSFSGARLPHARHGEHLAGAPGQARHSHRAGRRDARRWPWPTEFVERPTPPQGGEPERRRDERRTRRQAGVSEKQAHERCCERGSPKRAWRSQAPLKRSRDASNR